MSEYRYTDAYKDAHDAEAARGLGFAVGTSMPDDLSKFDPAHSRPEFFHLMREIIARLEAIEHRAATRIAQIDARLDKLEAPEQPLQDAIAAVEAQEQAP